MIGREPFTAADLAAQAAAIGLELVGPARIAAGILNATVWHYAPLIAQKTGADLKPAERADKRIEAAILRLRSALHGRDHPLAPAVAVEAANPPQKPRRWGSARAGQHDMRDFVGGALPAVVAFVFDGNTVAQRAAFVTFVCQRVGLGIKSAQAIRKDVQRHAAARKNPEMCNLPRIVWDMDKSNRSRMSQQRKQVRR